MLPTEGPGVPLSCGDWHPAHGASPPAQTLPASHSWAQSWVPKAAAAAFPGLWCREPRLWPGSGPHGRQFYLRPDQFQLYVLPGSQTPAPGAMAGVTVCDVEHVLFLSIGYKNLVFSHHFGARSCYRAFCPNSLILRSRWVVGRTKLAPPSFGASLPPSPFPTGDGAGWGTCCFPLAVLSVVRQLPAARWDLMGPQASARCQRRSRVCRCVCLTCHPGAPTLALCWSPAFPQVTHSDCAGLFLNLCACIFLLSLKCLLSPNWNETGIFVARIWPGAAWAQ